MARREELNKRLVDVAARAVAYVRDDALASKVEACMPEMGRPSFHRDHLWLTTLYLQGILAGEDAQTDARKLLLGVRTDSAECHGVRTDRVPPRYSVEEARAVAAELETACAADADGRLAQRRRLLVEARDATGVARVDWLDDKGRLALALEIDALGVLYDLCVAITYGMNRRGVGKVPAFHVESRQTRDGDWIGLASDNVASADMILDSLAVRAFLWFTGASRKGDSEVCDFESVRRRIADEGSSDYIVGMVQNAVAAVRGRELREGSSPALVKERLDAPVADAEGEEHTMLDSLSSGEAGEAHEEFDRARFFAHVVGALSPKLYRYLKLIHGGMPKMKALEMVGAKSAHFVQREAKVLVERLAEHDGEDFRELANMLVALCGR